MKLDFFCHLYLLWWLWIFPVTSSMSSDFIVHRCLSCHLFLERWVWIRTVIRSMCGEWGFHQQLMLVMPFILWELICDLLLVGVSWHVSLQKIGDISSHWCLSCSGTYSLRGGLEFIVYGCCLSPVLCVCSESDFKSFTCSVPCSNKLIFKDVRGVTPWPRTRQR